MTDSILRRCRECGRYSLHAACPGCGSPTSTPHPARFSPQDRWARYRRALYAETVPAPSTAAGPNGPGK
ncbi:MAG: RNA-protein complex protein Nop10 [Thermoplasmata archaeon]|nr:RNA-protein complex protein Nop10 [Thermoplasmata archaeon]